MKKYHTTLLCSAYVAVWQCGDEKQCAQLKQWVIRKDTDTSCCRCLLILHTASRKFAHRRHHNCTSNTQNSISALFYQKLHNADRSSVYGI